jgi:hypothetical protein
MPSSYTPNLRFTLPVTGELTGAWGVTVNNGITSLVDASISGTTTITVWGVGDYTLTANDGAVDEARRMFIVASGAPGAAKNIICPAVSKLYFVTNSVSGGFDVTLKTATGTGVTVPNGTSMLLRCDGTDVVDAVTSLASPVLTGTPTAPTAPGGTNTTQIATTAFAYANFAPLISPALTGTPTAPTAPGGTNTTQIATTAFAMGMQSPAFTGTPTAPTAPGGTNTTQIATTAFAMGMQSPAFTGTPTAPTATAGSSTTQIATTAFVAATAFSSVLPGQLGNAGKFVTTNGTSASWADAVTPTGVQTLTNKTLDDPKLLLGGTNGTAGQVPVSQGAGLPPIWSSPTPPTGSILYLNNVYGGF